MAFCNSRLFLIPFSIDDESFVVIPFSACLEMSAGGTAYLYSLQGILRNAKRVECCGLP